MSPKKKNYKMIKNYRHIYNSLFAITIIGSILFCTNNAEAAKRTISSIMIDAETGDVLSASNADERRYPASLTKMMTLYITFNALDKGIIKMEDMLPVSRTAANRSPSKLGLRAGEKIKVKDAVMALIVKSANDCATVLAEGLGYSEERFAQTMTKVAKELGMKNTTFKNASGLPNKAQKSTARDMAILGAALYHHFPQYYKLFSTKKFSYGGRTYYTHNHLLKNFAGADGMKTGFTNAAGYNIVTSAQRNGHRVIAVTMGHNTIKSRDKQIANMMNKGLNKLTLASKMEAPKLYAELPKQHTHNKKIQANKKWSIQVGAFSNYAKARSYALNIRKQAQIASVRQADIDIEPTKKGAAVIYRSKIIGLKKNEADKTCNSLKRSNKSCIVVAMTKTPQLAMAESKQ